jgi:hypothetical protein
VRAQSERYEQEGGGRDRATVISEVGVTLLGLATNGLTMEDEETGISEVEVSRGERPDAHVGPSSSHARVDDLRPLVGDINFEDTPGGFEVWYSDRVANDYPDLVDESADWLEDQLGVLNLGQIDGKVLVADGLLTDAIKNGLTAWWKSKIGDLDLR